MPNPVQEIRPEELLQLLAGDSACQIVDVREAPEYEERHLDGSILVSLSKIKDRSSVIDPEVPVVLVCKSGKRSYIGALELERLGITNVKVLAGGLDAWLTLGYPFRRLGADTLIQRMVLCLAGATALVLPACGLFVNPASQVVAFLTGALLIVSALAPGRCEVVHSHPRL